MKKEIEKEPEDDKHRKSRHITNWFVKKVDRFQEFKMLGCKDCIVSFDPDSHWLQSQRKLRRSNMWHMRQRHIWHATSTNVKHCCLIILL